jgi:hypothetical protein
MKGTLSLQRLKRAVAVAGVGALVVGGALLGTTQAHAAVAKIGTGTGLTLTPASGGAGSTATTTPTFNSTACPAGDNGSATINAIDPTTPAGTAPQNINASQVSAVFAPASAAFSGSWNATLASVFGTAGGDHITAGVQFEVAVECFSDAAATVGGAYVNSTFVTINADGSFTANQAFVGAPQSVNLTLTAAPNPATSGQSVTLTATASVNGATGTVTFMNNGTSLGTGTLSGGTPSTASLIITAPTETVLTNVPLTAVLTSPGAGFTAGTQGSLSLPVQPPPVNPTSATGTIPLAVTVPLSGTFTLTVNATTWVVLSVNTAGTTGTAATTPIVVTDTYNSYPGWSVTGEATQWHGVTNPAAEVPSGYPAASDIPADHGSQHIAADQLGWQPTNTGTLPTGVTLGNAITAGTSPNGLGDAFQTLATGAPGIGSFTGAGGVTLGANLTLAIPAGQEEGPYAAFLNIDATSGTP